MQTQSLLGILAVLVLILGGIYYLFDLGNGPNQTMFDIPAGEKIVTYEWQLTELPEHPSVPGMPRTGVVLVAIGNTYPVGEYDGSCFVIEESSWTLLENEKSGVICWWAGGGSEVGVFDEGGVLTLKEGILDEGSSEVPGFRGDFKTILEL